MAKQKIRFIINPQSGVEKKRQLDNLIQKSLNHQKYDCDIQFTTHAGHAIDLAKNAVEEGFEVVVAVGGDGSVNEVATSLIGTNTILGILPLGSGNGFAGHLGLGRTAKFALEVLNNGEVTTIDTCKVNDISFVNLVGFGFDGLVAQQIKGSKIRGLIGYIRSTIRHLFTYQSAHYVISIDEQPTFERDCYMLNIVNGTTYGYDFHFYSKAKLNDGLIHVLMVNDAPKWRYIGLLYLSLQGKLHKSKLVEVYDAKRVQVTTNEEVLMQMDGESRSAKSPFDIKIIPNSLKVLVPKKSEYLA